MSSPSKMSSSVIVLAILTIFLHVVNECVDERNPLWIQNQPRDSKIQIRIVLIAVLLY
jgi:hypothetical protein